MFVRVVVLVGLFIGYSSFENGTDEFSTFSTSSNPYVNTN